MSFPLDEFLLIELGGLVRPRKQMISQRRHRYPKGDCRLPGPTAVGAVALPVGAKVESSLPVLWQESCLS